MSAHDPIPVSLITGFLGSGKTTLLNHLLSDPAMERTAVLVNEFGEVGIDHLIVRELDEGAVLLKSGCIFCTVQGELTDGLRELYMKRAAASLPEFERVAIETTGLADPLPIVARLVRDPLFKHAYRLGGLITTVDALHGEAQLERHVEALRQACVADRLVITKSDLAGQPQVSALRRRLAHLNPGATILVASHGAVAADRLLDASPFDPQSKSSDVRRWLDEEASAADVGRHDERIVSFCVTLQDPLPYEAFERWFVDFAEVHADSILRVKGILNVSGESEPFVVHCVQSTHHAPARLAGWPDEDRRSRIIFITHCLPRKVVETSLREFLARFEPSRARAAGPIAVPDSAGLWLNETELTRMFSALSSSDDWVAASALRWMLLTGVVADDVRSVRWEELDLEGRVWLKPAVPAREGKPAQRPRRILLGEFAMMLVRELQKEREFPGGAIFPCAEPELPRSRLDAVWSAAAGRAGLRDTSLAALRPVPAGMLFRGLPAALVRRLLGLTTEDDPPLRKARR